MEQPERYLSEEDKRETQKWWWTLGQETNMEILSSYELYAQVYYNVDLL